MGSVGGMLLRPRDDVAGNIDFVLHPTSRRLGIGSKRGRVVERVGHRNGDRSDLSDALWTVETISTCPCRSASRPVPRLPLRTTRFGAADAVL